MIWWFYNVLFAFVYLLILPRFLLRMRRRGGYRRGFLQRFGIYGPDIRAKLALPAGRFLIHAVSVGEIQVALRFMAELRARRPGIAFALTTTTSTAHAIAEKQIGGDDVLLYFPVDCPVVVRRVLNEIRPQGLILVESELWPNLIRQAAQRQIPVMLLNGRISPRSFRGYKLLRPFVRRILEKFSVLCAQSAEDAVRLIALGAENKRVHVTGSAKYDIAGTDARPDETFLAKLQALGFGPANQVLLGGSTWPGEEPVLLDIYKRLRGRHPTLRLALAPRHAERRKKIVAELLQSGLNFKLWSEVSCGKPQGLITEKPDVLLVDTTGELRAFYSVADVVFIGKSLTSKGGQNPIEAAVCAKPIVAGPHMENFSAVMQDFLEAQAIIKIDDKAELERAMGTLLGDENQRRLLGERAHQVVAKKSGALRKSVDLFLKMGNFPPEGGPAEAGTTDLSSRRHDDTDNTDNV